MTESNSSNAQQEFPTNNFTYTTAEIERNTFFGEIPNPVYFAMAEPPSEVSPISLIVIDGEIFEIIDEAPPGAKVPDPVLLELVGNS